MTAHEEFAKEEEKEEEKRRRMMNKKTNKETGQRLESRSDLETYIYFAFANKQKAGK